MSDRITVRSAGGRRFTWPAVLAAALAASVGCSGGPETGEVSGVVTVNGQVPAEGSSITFVPADGKVSGGGALLQDGKYAVSLAVGEYKVEIRVPESAKPPKGAKTDGPGPGSVGLIKESLPAKYNSKTELTFKVVSGRNEKDWDMKK